MSLRMTFLRRTLVMLGVLGVSGNVQGADLAKVTIQANGNRFENSPIVAKLATNEFADGSYQLISDDAGKAAIEAQIYSDAGASYLALIIDELEAGASQSYRLVSAEETQGDGIQIKPNGSDVLILRDGEMVGVYRSGDGPKPYLHPLVGPTGLPITRAYPMEEIEGEDRDHPHQRSFWFTHGDVNGVDFWASDPLNRPRPNFGIIKEASRPTLVSGPVTGLFRTTNLWTESSGDNLCEDERLWQTFDLDGDRTLIDVEVILKATNGPVTFGDTKEGSFGLRLASSMNVKRKTGGKITNAEGIHDYEAWGKASAWVDYVGPVDSEMVGVAIMNHPESFRYPTTWHVRDYGLFAANPFGYSDFKYAESGAYTIEAGESIKLRYRVVLHRGNTEEAKIAEAFENYSNPPTIKVVPVSE